MRGEISVTGGRKTGIHQIPLFKLGFGKTSVKTGAWMQKQVKEIEVKLKNPRGLSGLNAERRILVLFQDSK